MLRLDVGCLGRYRLRIVIADEVTRLRIPQPRSLCGRIPITHVALLVDVILFMQALPITVGEIKLRLERGPQQIGHSLVTNDEGVK